MRYRAIMAGVALALALSAAGCTNYGYIVRTDGAPLYADEDKSRVVDRLERLEDGYIGHFAPDDDEDAIKIRYHGRTGYANREDLRLFKYRNDDHSRYHAVFNNRREVILEGKDWPAGFEQAIRENRIENGMTREMVQLAWGRPTSVQTLPAPAGATETAGAAGEKWSYERLRWDYVDDIHYDWYPGGTRLYYGFGSWGYGTWGSSWGVGYSFPYYEPHYFRTYYARPERRSVTFDATGTVTGWESTRY